MVNAQLATPKININNPNYNSAKNQFHLYNWMNVESLTTIELNA